LRILLLSPRVSGVGGIAQHVRRLVWGLREAGHEVELLSIEAFSFYSTIMDIKIAHRHQQDHERAYYPQVQ